MKTVVISDTHGTKPELPSADILVHCGDFLGRGSYKEFLDFKKWIGDIRGNYKNVIISPGNHDIWVSQNESQAKLEFAEIGATLLIDEGVELEGKKIYASPWTPTFGTWAYMTDEEGLERKFSGIPTGLDLLITHGPPRGVLDLVNGGRNSAGSISLMKKVLEVNPVHHCFGHLHYNGVGVKITSDTVFANCSVLNDGYEPNGFGVYVCNL